MSGIVCRIFNASDASSKYHEQAHRSQELRSRLKFSKAAALVDRFNDAQCLRFATHVGQCLCQRVGKSFDRPNINLAISS